MATIQRVQPGDLITADQINAMIDALNALQAQAGSSSTPNQVVISDLIPPSGTVQVGHELQVLGQNFRFEAGGLSVYIDDFRVNALTSASDTKLVFNIPSNITPPVTQDRPVLLTVNNGFTSAQRTLVLQPAISLSGGVDIILQGTTPTTPVPGVFVLSFSLRSRASIDTTFTIDPVVSVPAWQPSVQVLDQSQAVVSSRQIQLSIHEEKQFFVRVTIPPGTTSTPFNVTVTATSGSVGDNNAQSFIVGNAAPQPDPAIKTLGSPTGQVFGGAGSVTNSQISLAPGASAAVHLSASFTLPVAYTITMPLTGGATNWEVLNVPATTPSPLTISSGEISAGGGTAPKTLDFSVKPLSGATNGKVEFTVQRPGQTPRTFPMNVQVI